MYISKVKPLQVCKDYYGRSTSIASYIPNDSVNFCYSRKNILCSSATKIILKVYNDSKNVWITCSSFTHTVSKWMISIWMRLPETLYPETAGESNFLALIDYWNVLFLVELYSVDFLVCFILFYLRNSKAPTEYWKRSQMVFTDVTFLIPMLCSEFAVLKIW